MRSAESQVEATVIVLPRRTSTLGVVPYLVLVALSGLIVAGVVHSKHEAHGVTSCASHK